MNTWQLRHSFGGLSRLDLREYIRQRVFRLNHSLSLTGFTLRNTSDDYVYVGNHTHTKSVELLARGACLGPLAEFTVQNTVPGIITLWSAQRIGVVDILAFYELTPMQLGAGEAASNETAPSVADIGHKCVCDFYSVILATGCKCGGT